MSIFSKILGSHTSTNPYKAAAPYLEHIPSELHQYYDPYVQLGNYGRELQPGLVDSYRQMVGTPEMSDMLTGQYQQMAQDPNAYYAQLGQGFQQDPGYQYNLDQQLAAQDRAMAAGGMLGSPEHQKMNSQVASNLANQYYHNYLNDQLGIASAGLMGLENQRGAGLSGLGNISGQDLNYGFNAANQLGSGMSDYWRNRAGLAAGRAQDSRNRIQGGIGSFLGGFSSGIKVPGGTL